MINLNEPARIDLREIWIYVSEKNVDAANQLFQVFQQKFLLLEQNPKVGRERNDVLLNLRSFPVKNYLIFYTPLQNGIEVFRVLHGSRNAADLFDNYFEGLNE